MSRTYEAASRRTVEVSTYLLPPDLRIARACPACGGSLELHQPTATDPDRLLATCDACAAWHVIKLKDRTMTVVPI